MAPKRLLEDNAPLSLLTILILYWLFSIFIFFGNCL